MSFTKPQSSFARGEISPSLFGRVDLETYQKGLRTCRNFIVQRQGGVVNRPGTQFVAEVHDSTKATRLIPFQFSPTQTYVLELGDKTMRVIKNGALVTVSGSPLVVVTPWSSSELFQLRYVQSLDVITVVHPNHYPQQISRISDTAWTVTDFANINGPFRDLNTDKANRMLVNGITGTVQIASFSSEFKSDAFIGALLKLYIDPAQDTTPVWEVGKVKVVNDIVVANGNYYICTVAGTTGSVPPEHLEGTAQDGTPGVTWQYIHSGHGYVKITSRSSYMNATGLVINRLPFPAKNITNVSLAAVITCPNHGLATGNYVNVTGVEGATEVNVFNKIITVIDANTFTIDGITVASTYTVGTGAVQVVPGGGTYASITYKWAFGAWGADQLYPQAVAYYQQRQAFGGIYNNPQRLDLSASGAAYTDFRENLPLLDDDAVSVSLASSEIRHLVELSYLLILTTEGVWELLGGQNGDGVVTPGSVQVKRQSINSVAEIAPLRVENQVLYVQEKGQQVHGAGYNEQFRFVKEDLSIISDHLFQGKKIVDWCYQETPNSCIWCVMSDGSLLSLTYMPEQAVIAWSRHDSVNGKVESGCCVTEDARDRVYFVVNRTVGGVAKRYVERLDTREFVDVRDAYFVDCGLSFDGRNTTTTAITITGSGYAPTDILTLTASAALFTAGDVGKWIDYYDAAAGIRYRLEIAGYTSSTVVTAYANRSLPAAYQAIPRTDWERAYKVFGGLGHLEGRSVVALADGFVIPAMTVFSGQVTLPAAASVVKVGLPITADLETLDLADAGSDIRSKKKLVKKVNVLVDKSSNIKAGPDADHLDLFLQRTTETYDQPTNVLSDLAQIHIQAAWDNKGRIFVRQDLPLPLTILAVTPEIELGG